MQNSTGEIVIQVAFGALGIAGVAATVGVLLGRHRIAAAATA